MILGVPSTDEDLKPLLHNSNTLDDQEDDCDTSGITCSEGKHTSTSPTPPLSSETTTTTIELIPVLPTSTDKLTAEAAATTAAAATATITDMDEPKYCRICWEGEEKQDDDGDYYDYKQHDDEESMIGIPMIPSTTMTLQQPPGSGYSPQNDSSMMSNNSNGNTTGITMQQNPPITPTIPIPTMTTTKRQKHNNTRKQKERIQQHNPLIRPCKCSGTMMYVHASCLNHWRSTAVSPRSTSYVACDLCGYEYNIYRPTFAVIVTNPYFLRIMTVLLVMMAILVCAYSCKLADIYILGHLPRPGSDDWIQLHGASSWLWMDRFYLFAGLIVISMLGMVYWIYLCVTRPEEVTFITNHSSTDHGGGGADGEGGGGLSFFCCDQTSCPWYTCYLADFAACSGDSPASGFLIFIVLISLVAILFGVFGAVTGVFRFMESWVDSIAGHIKERILDVD